MLIVRAVVIVQMQRLDSRRHDLELLFHATHDMRVARIENVIHMEMRHLIELPEPLSGSEIVADIF